MIEFPLQFPCGLEYRILFGSKVETNPMATRSILFSKRFTIDSGSSDLIYDAEKQISMVRVGERLEPAIDQPHRLPTNSKTHQAPTDDDPDPGIEELY